jgi:hypothetical protein
MPNLTFSRGWAEIAYLDKHVFARSLREERLSNDFTERLANLLAPALAHIANQLPEVSRGTQIAENAL